MDRAEQDPLIGAMGGTLGIIGALLERANVATIDEFAGALRIYGTVTNERNPDEAAIIGQWVVALEELAAKR